MVGIFSGIYNYTYPNIIQKPGIIHELEIFFLQKVVPRRTWRRCKMTWWASSTPTPFSLAMDLKMISGKDGGQARCFNVKSIYFFVERTLQHLQFQGPAACPLCCARHICSVSSLLRSSIQAITKIASFLLPQGNHGHVVQLWSQKTTVVFSLFNWPSLENFYL